MGVLLVSSAESVTAPSLLAAVGDDEGVVVLLSSMLTDETALSLMHRVYSMASVIGVIANVGVDHENQLAPSTAHAVLGGTFDHLHAGHAMMLSAAIWTIRGRPSDTMVAGKALAAHLQPYDRRAEALRAFIARLDPAVQCDIVPLEDMFGPSLRSHCNVLVVSKETERGALAVNAKRQEQGSAPLRVLIVETIGFGSSAIADKISSTAIRKKADRRDRLRQRWDRLSNSIGVDAESSSEWFVRLADLYDSPARFYHTLAHLDAIFKLVDGGLDGIALDSTVIELATWFHDAIYDTDRSDNEERSAHLAAEFVAGTSLSADRAARIQLLILATKSHTVEANDAFDVELFLDLDMAVLGADDAEYDQYARDIALEYTRSYTTEAFRTGRMRVLHGFLDRKRIFLSDVMHMRLETQARSNITRELATLNALQHTIPP